MAVPIDIIGIRQKQNHGDCFIGVSVHISKLLESVIRDICSPSATPQEAVLIQTTRNIASQYSKIATERSIRPGLSS